MGHEVGWVYKYALIVVTILTFVSFGFYMYLGWQIETPTDSQGKMLEWISTISKSGFGTFSGMLIGKSTT